ncbi:MAG: hypothetical protein R6V19_10945 [Armatimonadota bacterium]
MNGPGAQNRAQAIIFVLLGAAAWFFLRKPAAYLGSVALWNMGVRNSVVLDIAVAVAAIAPPVVIGGLVAWATGFGKLSDRYAAVSPAIGTVALGVSTVVAMWPDDAVPLIILGVVFHPLVIGALGYAGAQLARSLRDRAHGSKDDDADATKKK